MRNLTDIVDCPLTAKACIARGRFYKDELANKIFIATRFLDRKTGRYFYDLYKDDELYLTKVNPLFLDFIEIL